jgi:acyl dehydratase/NAD(P)-dependent dehydrogenase (short-subunit alcohol dehydrogenase family)
MFSFSSERQELFAQLSGDYNPIHMDPVVCRRLIHGRPLVHGVHALLWALNVWLEAEVDRIRVTRLSVKFRSPSFVGKIPQVAVTSQGDRAAKLAVTVDGSKTLTAVVEWQRATIADLDLPSSIAERVVCRNPSIPEMKSLRGEIPIVLDRPLAKTLFPNVERCLAAEQIAVLLATSRLVGMEVPGLNSIFGGMELEATEDSRKPLLAYRVEGYDERLSVLAIRVDGPGLGGVVSALLRPEPKRQKTLADLRKLVPADLFRGERALVVGGSRGLGEVAAKELALGGAEVRLTYHQGARDAENVVSEIVASGGVAECFAYDVLGNAAGLASLVRDWAPTILCYFATPYIEPGSKGRFSSEKFIRFCEYYVRGFHDTLQAVRGPELQSVVYPSSSLLDENPSTFAEYIAAKSAGEALCRLLEKTTPGLRIDTPRLGRLATDQTASMLDEDVPDAAETILNVLTEMRGPRRPTG